MADRRAACRASPSCEADGSTACGCWIYSGVLRRRRQPGPPARPGRPRRARRLGVARVGLGVAGQPPHALQPRVAPTPRASRGRSARSTSGGTRSEGKWTGYDVPDFPVDKRPDYRAAGRRRQGHGRDLRRRAVHHDGRRPRLAVLAVAACSTGRCRRTTSRSSRRSTTRSTRTSAPTRSALRWARPENPYNAEPGDPRYPFVATTFRLTEHHTAGAMSRNLPWLAELQPEMFAEIDPVLAARARHRGRRLDDDLAPRARRSRRARR